MKEYSVDKTQSVNACTLISIAVIDLLLNSEDINTEILPEKIKKIITDSETRYQQLQQESSDNGAGLMETTVHRKFYTQYLVISKEQVIQSSSTEKLISELFNNRETYDNYEDFLIFNNDSVSQLFSEGVVIDWKNVLQELRDPAGYTFMGDGHTISVVKRNNIFYSFDSLTGRLSETQNIAEMADHLNRKMSNAPTIRYYSYTRNPALKNSFSQPQPAYLNQNCAETMITKAAEIVLNSAIEFDYAEGVSDDQIDIISAFIHTSTPGEIWYSGKSEDNFLDNLDKLDKDKVYFFRTGTNGGAGHWQTLYYYNAGWVSYSSENNIKTLTLESKHLTEDGLGMLTPHAKWGDKNGEYSFYIIEANEENINAAATFVRDFRNYGEEYAFLMLAEARDVIPSYRENSENVNVNNPINAVNNQSSDVNCVPLIPQSGSREIATFHKDEFEGNNKKIKGDNQSLNKHSVKKQSSSASFYRFTLKLLALAISAFVFLAASALVILSAAALLGFAPAIVAMTTLAGLVALTATTAVLVATGVTAAAVGLVSAVSAVKIMSSFKQSIKNDVEPKNYEPPSYF